LEAFFRRRGARATIDFCPLADPALLEALHRRGYNPTEFNNVLVRALAGAIPASAPHVLRVTPSEKDAWSHTVGCGFFERSDLTPEEMEIGRAIFSMPGALCYLARTETGELAGGAALAAHGGLATLFADSVIPVYRRRGLHRELITARLHHARAQGCDLATASTLPGSASQRNYERLGFQIAYTKVTLVR
jgi:GNAT superfamily N-acetyltransferase